MRARSELFAVAFQGRQGLGFLVAFSLGVVLQLLQLLDARAEGFDWRMIETKFPPSVTHAPLIARLVARRIDHIHAALVGMDQSAKAQLVWAGIRAPESPDFHETIQWTQAQLIEFRRMNLVSEQAPHNDAIPPRTCPQRFNRIVAAVAYLTQSPTPQLAAGDSPFQRRAPAIRW